MRSTTPPQVERLFANRGVAGGRATATTIANARVDEWHVNWHEGYSWGNLAMSAPAVKWTSSPIDALHRTLACQRTARPHASQIQQEVVNCGHATFTFSPGLSVGRAGDGSRPPAGAPRQTSTGCAPVTARSVTDILAASGGNMPPMLTAAHSSQLVRGLLVSVFLLPR